MKRERTKNTIVDLPQVTLQPKTKQDYDRYSQTYSIPHGLKFLSCVLSQTEIDIINRIVRLTSRYLDKGGCTLSNAVLADRHECSQPVVSSSISKAEWLGLLVDRKDDISKFTDKETGHTYVSQKRSLQMRLPLLWEVFGEIWAEFFYRGDEECGEVMRWAKGRISYYYKNREENPEWLRDFTAEVYKSTFRGYFENFYTPKVNLLGHQKEDFSLFILTVLNLQNNTSSSSSADAVELTPSPSPPNGNGFTSPPSSKESTSRDPITAAGFEKFWAIYPKNNGSKGKAKKAWEKLCHKPPAHRPTWGEVRGAVHAQKASPQWQGDPKYIPHASTWLNQERWLDDPGRMTGSNGNNSKVALGNRMQSHRVDPSKYRRPPDQEAPDNWWLTDQPQQ